MQAGIQISSFKPLMTDLEGLNRVLSFMQGISCTLTQLQWIDKSIAPGDIAAALEERGIRATGVQDKAFLFCEDPAYYASLCRSTGATDICLSGAEETGLDTFLSVLDKLKNRKDTRGLTFSFHPTKRDFDGALDRIMERCGFLRLTLDVCQAHDAGADVSDLLRRYRGRVDAVHFKDRDKSGALCPVGEGVIDFEQAAFCCREAGVQYIFAEQESWSDAFKELEKGFEYTQSLVQKYK